MFCHRETSHCEHPTDVNTTNVNTIFWFHLTSYHIGIRQESVGWVAHADLWEVQVESIGLRPQR